MEKKIAQKGPYIVQIKAGRYAWCACGQSENQPFCDGAHSKTDLRPIIVNLEENKEVAFCGCKHTNGAPFCDGTHNSL